MRKAYWVLTILFGVHLFLLANLQFTAWPEMLSYPYLRNQGFLLYQDLIHPYPPLLTMILSFLYSVFGYQLWVMEAFSWLLFLTNDLLIFLLVRRLTKNNFASLLSVFLYVILQPFLEGNMLWFDTVIVTPILLGTYFLIDKKYFWSGMALALAALIKQTTGLFLIVGTVFIYWRDKNFKNVYQYSIAPIVIAAILAVKLLINNSLVYFLNWTLVYPATWWSKFPGYVQMGLSTHQSLILMVLLAPLVMMVFRKKSSVFKKKDLALVLLLLFLSFFMVYPRFSFFHFQTALAFIVVLSGSMAVRVKPPRLVSVLYFVFLVSVVILPAIRREWGEEARFYGSEDLEKAEIIQEVVGVSQKVFLLGPHSGLYALADRQPPKPWADNFGWYLEIPGVQEEILARWEDNPPDFIFWQESREGNWYDLATYQPQKITEWVKADYTKKEIAWEGVWLWQRND